MKIICVGRNYRDHAAELNNEVPEQPVIFMKPDSALLQNNMPFFIPPFSQEIHYEVELVVRIHRIGKHIQPKFAHKYYNQLGLGIDFTARDLQQQLKSKGLPWEKAKGFDGSALVSSFVSTDTFETLDTIDFRLEKNGQTVQQGHTKDMLWGINALIAYISQYFTLKIGDLIFTGTPAGVGPVVENDLLEGFLGERSMFQLQVK
ncbi:MAG: fumarylacetoacetate hydrolase family protein [Flavobacteriaceae bacterium]